MKPKRPMCAPNERLLRLAKKGDADAFQQVLQLHRDRLERLVAARMDFRLRARFVPSDLAQAIFVEALHRRTEFFSDGQLPIYVWVRQIAVDRLDDLHRRHLPSSPRLPGVELARCVDWQRLLAVRAPGIDARNLTHLNHRQRQRRVCAAISQLRTPDREILAMHHLEQLSMGELSAMLRISTSAAVARYRRAVDRLCAHAKRLLLTGRVSNAAH